MWPWVMPHLQVPVLMASCDGLIEIRGKSAVAIHNEGDMLRYGSRLKDSRHPMTQKFRCRCPQASIFRLFLAAWQPRHHVEGKNITQGCWSRLSHWRAWFIVAARDYRTLHFHICALIIVWVSWPTIDKQRFGLLPAAEYTNMGTLCALCSTCDVEHWVNTCPKRSHETGIQQAVAKLYYLLFASRRYHSILSLLHGRPS